jgi:tRNA/tmRNA/rRNA uracil-C5-methylase (TrmA/RlmC/RlmD family)
MHPPMLTAGQILTLNIEKPAAGGRMIARSEGQVVLVSGAIPGETVTARVERVGRGVAYAETISVERESPDRRKIDDDPLCGGCVYAHINYARQLAVKALVVEDAFARIGHLSLPEALNVAPSPEDAYRMRARLHVRDGRIGFFREGTHDLCDPRSTRQLRGDTCDTLDRLAAGLRSLGMAGVRELDVSENIDASQRVVHLDTATLASRGALTGLGMSEGLTGLTVSAPPGRGPRSSVVAGSPYVVDTIAIDGQEVKLRRHVLAFFQGNRFLLPALVEHVLDHISKGGRVIDLYAGAGLFAVSAAVLRGAQVIAVEGDRAAAEDLMANAESTEHHVKAVHEPVEVFTARQHNTPSIVIVDPPRTGLSNDALMGAIRLDAPTIVYVSCDVATLARDSRKLVDAGYRIERVVAFDLFPNTPHVESVVTLVR